MRPKPRRETKVMGDGLMDAELDGFPYRKQVARPGGGYRTLLSARIDNRSVIPPSHQIR